MRVEIDDYMAYRHTIDSTNPETLGLWFAEWAQALMSANAQASDCRLRIWPQTDEEFRTIGQNDFHVPVDTLRKISRLLITKVDETEDKSMSGARWCDWGDHAFKADREGTVMMGQNNRTENGQVVQEVKEMCPECAAQLGLTDYVAPPSPAERRRALMAGLKEEGKKK